MSPLFLDASALTYRPDLDVLFVRWPQPVYSLPVRSVYQQVLGLAKETNARYWLFDVRSRGPLSAEDAAWVLEEFYPSLHGQFKHITHVAYLLSPAHFEDDACLKAVQEARQENWFGTWADFEGFTSETDALDWLHKHQRAHVIS